ncbi:Hypothetical protein CINCED_3A000191 [Cinara cedri]|uniref:Uncharacterized protein n=1 Tax=Cinara cedri TaxID=506608 RepID=A0A5E4NHH0_9HEMI|nr:Hypothetical protein CINCED_3A000191 [Cinara cedri]
MSSRTENTAGGHDGEKQIRLDGNPSVVRMRKRLDGARGWGVEEKPGTGRKISSLLSKGFSVCVCVCVCCEKLTVQQCGGGIASSAARSSINRRRRRRRGRSTCCASFARAANPKG